ncbi:methylated-DNA--protein-cysteine methyltransferase [Marmoricola endophyticus]|uniref:Methylated-DNA--protein-cysteine methyltransferase n=1 Tax=Marmoricola endophyticus TaxID=2040280 RepID=A0A917BSE7_9ACTN|nr:methylated-DNA--[protein]-cysteine S-methyltransferase [Marmoricola endophyticus]GGF55690.1 methylated-DNA--protein-cysteine methyltransferase [Marmoricola endophyticus]
MSTTDDLLSTIGRDDDPATMARLHARLEESRDVDVAYRVVDSPLGDLLVATTERGVVRVGFESVGHDAVLDELGRDLSPRVLRAPRRLDDAARQLAEYFGGERERFDLRLDTRLAHGFRLEVVEHLREIGYGETASYAQVAELAGRPRAIRAVGTACARNPLPVVLPCHRVVRSDGTPGQYAGGPAAKRYLLDLESAGA